MIDREAIADALTLFAGASAKFADHLDRRGSAVIAAFQGAARAFTGEEIRAAASAYVAEEPFEFTPAGLRHWCGEMRRRAALAAADAAERGHVPASAEVASDYLKKLRRITG